MDPARSYIAGTSFPGYTMQRMGIEKSLECLHPRFVIALAGAIEEARARGLTHAGVFSACRPPILGVGGFRDKHDSLHAYGLAVDMYGIGRPGSDDSRLWNEVAQRHGLVNPYGWRHGVEWNHYQATWTTRITKKHPLRETITAEGPIDVEQMWQAQDAFLAFGKPPPPKAKVKKKKKKDLKKSKKKKDAKKSKKKKQKLKKRKKRR
jgi:hypothetical protein